MARSQSERFQAGLAIPIVYQVAGHVLSISFVSEGRWTVSIDGTLTQQTYRTQADAWEAGVRSADLQDRPR
jgi:hypothetical protein